MAPLKLTSIEHLFPHRLSYGLSVPIPKSRQLQGINLQARRHILWNRAIPKRSHCCRSRMVEQDICRCAAPHWSKCEGAEPGVPGGGTRREEQVHCALALRGNA